MPDPSTSDSDDSDDAMSMPDLPAADGGDPGDAPDREVNALLNNFHVAHMCRELVELVTQGTTKRAIESVMAIVSNSMSSILPDDLELPTTWHMITKAAGSVPPTHSKMVLCPAKGCNMVHSRASAVPGSLCASCDTELTTHRGDPHMIMLEGNLVDHMVRLWNEPRLAVLMDYPQTRDRGDGDVWDAGVLRGIDPDKRINTICMSVCTDGSVLKRYRNDSYTPFLVRILNLPPYVRTKSSALILWAMVPPKVYTCNLMRVRIYCARYVHTLFMPLGRII